MIKKAVLFAVSVSAVMITAVACFNSAIGQKPGAENCSIETQSFQTGESLTYKVYYNAGPMWVNAGEVYFKLQNTSMNNKQLYHAVSEAITYPSFDWFFKVRDKMETWMEPATLKSEKFQRDVNEGGYTFFRSYDWNRETNTIISFEDRKNGKTKTKTITNVEPCAVDLLSSFYWARTINFDNYKPGDKIPVTMAVDDTVYSLYIRYEGKEKYKTKLGTFNCMKVKPLLVEGAVFRAGEGMTIWFTDDANRIPVRIESHLLVGLITC
ncbi:MAG: DUF3108 domain-containing protein, partial [Chitinophagales bacterium]